ncbi:MAG TPA: sortase [Candidatus Paceibacterota bacterium]|nr:sortase [Candidatus Paceibacterota bacterium]
MSLTVPKLARAAKRSLVWLILVFIGVFGAVLLLFNLPAIIDSISYALTHSEDSDNEKLTEQYRALYGYASHPDLDYLSQQTPQPSLAPAQPDSSAPPVSESGTTLSIPKLDLSAPVLQVPSGLDADILAALKNGVVQFPGSANPGQQGMTVIVGHSSSTLPWTAYSAIFSQLDKLTTNDLIYITYNNRQYAYRVVAKRKGSAQEILDSGIAGDLLLSTCWPVGTDRNRIAVAAVRVAIDNR